MDLTKSRCVPCEGGAKPMKKKDAIENLRSAKGWKLKGSSIFLDKEFRNFVDAINFINKVAKLAEKEGHHPDICLHSWNKVRFTLSTHAIKGLSMNDFILAAKINSIR